MRKKTWLDISKVAIAKNGMDAAGIASRLPFLSFVFNFEGQDAIKNLGESTDSLSFRCDIGKVV